MSTTKYSILKEHFDKLILGGYPQSTGLEPIRSTYENAFNMNINRQDVYQTKFNIPTNPIKGIITLLGPNPKDDTDIPTGLIGMDESNVYYITHFTNDILKVTDEYAKNYIRNVFEAMRFIMEFDQFCINPFKHASNNPYIATIYAYPFYFTFQHIRTCFPHLIDHDEFFNILEQYYMDSEFIPEVLKSLKENKYSDDTEVIHSLISCKNTIPII